MKQLVKLLEVFEDNDHVYLVTELVEGEEMFTLVNKERITENKA